MIRFINLTNQIIEDDIPHFAFYDTVYDKFCTFDNSQDWFSIEDFISHFNTRRSEFYTDINRFLNVIPNSFKDKYKYPVVKKIKDEVISIEWITDDWRFAICIEPDKNESNWSLVIKGKDSYSGLLSNEFMELLKDEITC